jgi:two-component system chemotaxis response regulator CheB
MKADTSGREPDGGGVRRHALVALASSAGGIRALTTVLSGLPENFPVPVVAVQHLDPSHRTVLADLLSARTSLDVRLAESGNELRPGAVWLAPPDRHLEIGPDGRLQLTGTARLNFSRPSADRLFISAAEVFGSRLVACVLTGAGRDGAAGVRAVKAAGGTVLVQDPTEAEFRSMPEAAVATGAVDEKLPLDGIAKRLMELVETERA